jgi:hypothetical protein
MKRYCATRLLKNARFLQSPAVGFLPVAEPLDGFQSLVPGRVLMNLHLLSPEEIQIERLAKAVSRSRPPKGGPMPVSPLFSGTVRFVQTTFSSGGSSFAVPDADLKVAMQYAALGVAPISQYCSQYGSNKLALSPATIPFNAAVTGRKYNDSILSRWVDGLAKAQGLGADSCLAFLNPKGLVNTDADATQGVGGYHALSSSGVPYIFVNVLGEGLTLADHQDVYALALSHEIAEMTVDPLANGSNPEVSDECAGNCGVDYRNYFDTDGSWLGGASTPGYAFFIDGIATPAMVAQCPAPQSSCCYPPPKPAVSA